MFTAIKEKISTTCNNINLNKKKDSTKTHQESTQKLLDEKIIYSSQEAIVNLQKHIRGKHVQDTAVLPQELRNAWATIPSLTNMNNVEQLDFSRIITSELKNILSKPKLYGKEIYFSKDNAIYKFTTDPVKPKASPWSFYITIDPKNQIAVIELNEKKSESSFLGKGTYKIVHCGHKFAISLEMGLNGRLITKLETATQRALNPELFKSKLQASNQIHHAIYKKIKTENLPGYITEPPRLRVHIKNGQVKQELIQTRYLDLLKMLQIGTYQSDKDDSPQPIEYQTYLSIIECLFETVDTLNSLGITHRDIKPSNISMGNKDCIPYLNDFDLVKIDSAPGMDSEYAYWDMAGQIGLISHVSDVVGTMLTACELLFNCSEIIHYDVTHNAFKNGVQSALDTFIQITDYGNQLLNTPTDDPLIKNLDCQTRKDLAEERANIKILQIFCRVFKKEEKWKEKLLGSCICHFANLTAEEYKYFWRNERWEISSRFTAGVKNWTMTELRKIFDKYTPCSDTANETHQEYRSFFSGKDFKITFEDFQKYNHLHQQFMTLKNISKEIFPKTADPRLFALLNSKDPEKRKNGLEIGFKFFGKAGDLKQEIHQIRKEYLAELQQIKGGMVPKSPKRNSSS